MELQAVCEIGKLEKEKIEREGGGLLEIFVEDPSGGGRYNNVMEVVVDVERGYRHINVTQYDPKNLHKYLYKKGAPRGADLTPTAKVTEVEKTFSIKILACLKETLKDELPIEFEKEEKELNRVYCFLKKAEDQVVAELEKIFKEIPKKEGAFITIVVEKNGQKRYVGDYEIFKRKIVKDALKKFHYSKSQKIDIVGKNSKCSLCRETKETLFGLANVFPFYTIDKKGYISGGFKYERAWMNFPVCPDCSILLELGRKYLDDKLTFSFKGLNYYLIPNTIFPDQLENALKKLEGLNKLKNSRFADRYLAEEERILIRAGRELKENSISFELVFFEKSNSALNILLDVQDVMPSRLRKIYETLSEVNEEEIFKRFYLKQDKHHQIFINFDFVRTIFPRNTHNGYFLETINDIISDKKIDYIFLLRPIVEYITEAFNRLDKEKEEKNKDSYFSATLKAFSFLHYLNRMNLIRDGKEATPVARKSNVWKREDYESERDMFEDFFKTYEDFFDLPEKKICFLEGYLTKKLLNIQYAREESTPFLARLKGLKLTRKDIERLLPEIQNKLNEYDANYYRETEELISSYFLKAGSLWIIPDLDVPFYFSLGMNMASLFITKKEKEEEFDDDL
jgi:CRISPR-associated protein Csh1